MARPQASPTSHPPRPRPTVAASATSSSTWAASPSRPQRASVLEHTKGRYRGWGESVLSDGRPGRAVVRQDERVPFVAALERARQSAYAPGEYVEQESFMRAGQIRTLAERAGIADGVSVLDLCCGVAGPGRFIARELG